MSITERFINALFRFLFRLLYTFDAKEFAKVPRKGPLMIVANHTSALDGPLMYVFLRPRRMSALAKEELWNHWFTRFVMNLWTSIPINRQNMSKEAMNSCFSVLRNGNILAVAPEGTRSSDGALQQGKAGVAFIAYKEAVPLVPITLTGFEHSRRYWKKLRRAPLELRVGPVFEIVDNQGRLDAAKREHLVDEIMLRLAQQLPASLQGYYQDHPQVFTLTKLSNDLTEPTD
ncbi:MAG: lysophospholipid acyltransferase family protein [Sphaerochaetaceae bacterium]